MTDDNRHFDSEPGLEITPAFSEDLNRLFAPGRPVPASVDRAVAEAARRHLRRPQRRIGWKRWAVPAAAAAAILIAACLWWRHDSPIASSSREARPQATVASPSRADIDRNGRVDILDAMTLARHIESKQPIEAAWDINGDGLIDQRDVDSVARAAVRIHKGV